MERDAGFSNSLPEYFMLTEEEMEEFRLEKNVTTVKVNTLAHWWGRAEKKNTHTHTHIRAIRKGTKHACGLHKDSRQLLSFCLRPRSDDSRCGWVLIYITSL